MFGSPPPSKRWRNLEEVEFAEVGTPLALASYRARLSSIGPILQPTQEMVDEISVALANAEASPAVQAVYRARLLAPPLAVPYGCPYKRFGQMENTLRASAGETGTFAPNVAPSPHAICVRSGPMSRLGLLWGGLAAQLSHIKLLLSLAHWKLRPRKAISQGLIPLSPGER